MVVLKTEDQTSAGPKTEGLRGLHFNYRDAKNPRRTLTTITPRTESTVFQHSLTTTSPIYHTYQPSHQQPLKFQPRAHFGDNPKTSLPTRNAYPSQQTRPHNRRRLRHRSRHRPPFVSRRLLHHPFGANRIHTPTRFSVPSLLPARTTTIIILHFFHHQLFFSIHIYIQSPSSTTYRRDGIVSPSKRIQC